MKSNNKFLKLLTTCRVFSLAGIPVIVYFLYHDIAIYGYRELAYPRIFALGVMILTFVITLFIKENHYNILRNLYITELTLIMGMSTFVVVQLIIRYRAPFEHISGAVQALMSAIFIILLFAQTIPDKLFIIYSPVFLMFPFLIAAGVSKTEVSLTANPVVLCIVSIILGRIYYKFEIEEERMKTLLAEQKSKLQKTVSQLKDTVQMLNQEIERRKILEKQLRELSVKDPLTGVYNRRAAIDAIEKAIENFQTNREIFSICFIDLDNLKETNDNYGHEFGDKLIKTFAELLAENVRKNDKVFRVGGDEFIVLFYNASEEEARKIINRIADLARIKSTSLPMPISFSYGIATYRSGYTLDEFISLADTRMYEEKKRKKT